MNYKERTLEERIELASQYALLLVADDKPSWEIIGILKRDYALTEEQATQAVGNMRINYKDEYNSTLRSNLLKALVAFVVSMVIFLFYFFLGKEIGRGGIVFIIIAILFAVGGVGALLGVGRIIGEKISKPASIGHVFSKPERELDSIDKFLKSVAVMSGVFLCVAGYEYFGHAHMVDVTQVVTIHDCIITEPVRYEKTGGKSPTYYYVLKFRGSNLDYKFRSTYYSYSNGSSLTSELKEGDTVSIQVMKEDFDRLRDQYSTGHMDIVNLGWHGIFFVDHRYRNAELGKEQAGHFHLLLIVFVIVIPAIFFKRLYDINKYRRKTGR